MTEPQPIGRGATNSTAAVRATQYAGTMRATRRTAYPAVFGKAEPRSSERRNGPAMRNPDSAKKMSTPTHRWDRTKCSAGVVRHRLGRDEHGVHEHDEQGRDGHVF